MFAPALAAAAVAAACTPQDGPPAPDQLIYRYTDPSGRTAYTNGLSRVPAERRATAASVDLSGISTNSELGRDLEVALEREYEMLLASRGCEEAREAARTGWFREVWRGQGHLVVLGCGILLLLLFTPFALRRLDPPKWARVLTVAIPVLALAALFSHVAIETSRLHRRVLEQAQSCTPTEATTFRERLRLVDAIRAHVDSADISIETRTTER